MDVQEREELTTAWRTLLKVLHYTGYDLLYEKEVFTVSNCLRKAIGLDDMAEHSGIKQLNYAIGVLREYCNSNHSTNCDGCRLKDNDTEYGCALNNMASGWKEIES